MNLKRPAFQFYPGDWLEEVGLRASSLAARGLWIDMLCFMHQGTPFGHMTNKAGRPLSVPEIARSVGASPSLVARLLDELASHEVFSRTAEGVIYSRRQVRDEAHRQVRAEGGQKGGAAAFRNPNASRPGDKREGGRRGGTEGGSQGGNVRTPPPSPSPSPSPAPSPPPRTRDNKGETAASGFRSNRDDPPPAADAPWVDHNAHDALEARLVQRCEDLADMVAALEHQRAATDDERREVLVAVTTTARDGKSLDTVRGASRAWLEQSLRACDDFERDHEPEPPAAPA